MTNKCLFLGGLWMLLASTLLAQSQQFRYQLLEGANGLNRNRVLAFHEDHNGFMWIGTRSGLAKYDGYTSKLFYYSPTDSTSLPSDHIISFYEDPEGYLWMGSKGGGLIRLDLDTDQIKCFTMDYPMASEGFLSEIVPINDSLLLLGTSFGLVRFHMRTYETELLDDTPWFRAIAPYKDGTFLVGAKGGLRIFDPETDELIHFQDTTSGIRGPLLAYVNDILVDEDGLIWIASPDFGILTYDPDKKKLTRSCTDREDPECPVSALVSDLIQDKQGNIWVACSTGVAFYRRDLGEFVHLEGDTRDPSSPLTNHIYEIYLDKNENLWIGMGVNVVLSRLRSKPFNTLFHDPNDEGGLPKETIYSWAMNKNKDILLGTFGGGLVQLSPDMKVKHIYKYNPQKYNRSGRSSITSNSLIKVLQAKNGDLWVGAVNGLIEGELTADGTYNFISYRNPVPRGNFIYAMEEQPDGNIWIGSIAGLFEFNVDTHTFTHLLKDSTESTVYSLYYEEETNFLWIGGYAGLQKWDLTRDSVSIYKKNRKEKYAISSNTTNHIRRDPGGWYWVSTEFGLNLFDPVTEKFQVFLEKDGLPDHYISATFLDEEQNVWVSMTGGIVKLLVERKADGQPEIKGIRTYTIEDGVAANGHSFGSYLKGEDGTIYLGATGALTYFKPQDIVDDQEEAEVAITSFKVFNEDIPLSKQPAALTKIELDYFQNFFSLEFSSLDFANADKIHYAYMLEGVDPEWIFSNRRFAGYTKLAPGDYDFKVKATNGEGKWGEPTTLTIHIRPPFWLTWWFGVLIGIVILGIGFVISKVSARQRMIQKEKEVAERSSRHKAEFLANMSHEIRTPMNAVVGTTHLIQNTALDTQQKRYVETIRQSAENLLVIINDILDFSKIEAGKLTFIEKPFKIRELKEYVYQTLSYRALENDTTLNVTCDDKVPEVLVGDATRLIQILLNLGSNAVKFTKEGQVDIVLGGKADKLGKWRLDIKVRDTGIGIPAEKLRAIFDSFVQGGNEVVQQFGGTGLGLSIARRLVVDQGGEISVDSEVGQGTVFSVLLPYKIGNASDIQQPQTEFGAGNEVRKSLKLLLVEDNRINREIAVEIIQEMIPYAYIETAENGKEVIDLLTEANRYDLILMDIKMPIMDGYTCAKLIREQLPAPINRIPIIALTATATDEEIQNCLEIGMNDFVAKPFDPKMLKDKILKFTRQEEKSFSPKG